MMKNVMIVFFFMLLAIFYYIGCGDDNGANKSIVEPEPVVLDRPPIPEPTYYAGPVLDKSIELILATVVLSNFDPAVDSIWTQWCCDQNCDFGCRYYGTNPPGNRIYLVRNDTIVTNEDSLMTEVYPPPQSFPMLCYPLSSQPYLQHARYWVRLGNVERYSSSTSVTVTRSVTKGVERTEAEEFGSSIGMEATVSGGFFVEFSVTLRAEFSYSSSTELAVSEEETTEESFTITSPDNKNIVYCVWQLVDEFRIVGADGLPFKDPNFKFSNSSFVAVVPSTEFVPMTTYFDN